MSSIIRVPIQVRVPIISDKQNCCPYEQPFGYIYLVTNLINGHMYVGKHEFHHPWLDNSYQGSGIRLWRAYKKYGMKNFDTIILEWTDKDNDELNRLETYWIEVFGTYKFSCNYNMSSGGDGGYLLGDKTEEEKIEIRKRAGEHISKALIGVFAGSANPMFGVHRKHSLEEKEHQRQVMLGHIVSEETREKMRQSRNKNNELYLRMGEDNPFYGRHHTEEQKCKWRKVKGTPVVQLDLYGNFIKRWDSMSEPESEGFEHHYISNCCKGKAKKHKGYKWMYASEYYDRLNGGIE